MHHFYGTTGQTEGHGPQGARPSPVDQTIHLAQDELPLGASESGHDDADAIRWHETLRRRRQMENGEMRSRSRAGWSKLLL